jgi:hypothetical protein
VLQHDLADPLLLRRAQTHDPGQNEDIVVGVVTPPAGLDVAHAARVVPELMGSRESRLGLVEHDDVLVAADRLSSLFHLSSLAWPLRTHSSGLDREELVRSSSAT